MKTLNFEQWLNRMTESLTSPVKVEPTVNASAGIAVATKEVETSSSASSREDIMSNVDAIITSLETLSKELTEELQTESFTLNEEGPSWVRQWIIGKMAQSKQGKVNKARLNKVALEIAKDEAPNTDQREKLADREKTISKQIDGLQQAIDQRYKGKGDIVDRMIQTKKIEGQLAVLKAHTGQDLSQAQSQDLKSQMADLQRRYKENEDALKQLEPDEDEKQKMLDDEAQKLLDRAYKLKDEIPNTKDKVKKASLRLQIANIELEAELIKGDASGAKKKKTEIENLKADLAKAKEEAKNGNQSEEPEADKPKTEEPEADKPKTEEPEADKPEADKPEADKPEADKPEADKPEADKPEAEEPVDPKVKAIKDKIKEYEEGISALNAKDKKSKEDQDKIQILTTALASKKKELEKTQTPKESLFIDAFELGLTEIAKEIDNKSNWQFENNSALYRKYKMEIDKARASKILNESRYFGNGIADNFKKLL